MAWLTIQPPAGEHLNAAGPLRGWVEVDGQRLEIAGAGALLSPGIAVASPKGAVLSGALSVPLCEDSGGACRVADVHFSGTASRRPVLLASLSPPEPASSPHAQNFEAALVEALTTDRLVLLDFGAVWCPPCNRLAAELLEDPADAEALSGVVVLAIDADDPASWPLKDRYTVGGYPTLILTNAQGAEIDRMVGYPGEQETLDWLSQAPGRPALAQLLTPRSSPQAAAHALRFAERGEDETAAQWLAVATDPETQAFRRARLSLHPSAEDARWLMARQVPIESWVWDAVGLAESDAALTKDLLAAVRRALPDAAPLLAAELLWVAGGMSDEHAAPTLYAAGAAALTGVLTGEPDLDRGHYTFLAQLHERAGGVDAGLAVLRDAAAHYPEEFTFHYAAAGMLLRAEQPEAAAASIEAALLYSYGDNALRAARRKAEILHAWGQTGQAIDLIDDILAAAVRPGEGLQVRTTRYLTALETLRAELGAE